MQKKKDVADEPERNEVAMNEDGRYSECSDDLRKVLLLERVMFNKDVWGF